MGVAEAPPCKMKTIHQKSVIKIPDGVEVSVKSRVVSVKGDRGELTKSYKYKMKLVYAHFPVNVGIRDDKKHITVMNFIGQKVKFEVDALEGVDIVKDPKSQGEFTVEGNDIENVSRTCALISQSCYVKNKDIRKFLDGIYVSEKGNIVVDEE